MLSNILVSYLLFHNLVLGNERLQEMMEWYAIMITIVPIAMIFRTRFLNIADLLSVDIFYSYYYQYGQRERREIVRNRRTLLYR